MSEVKIVTYEDDLAGEFERLNRAWIERYFAVEEADEIMFRNPRAFIINEGGQIFFAQIGAATVGVCAAQKLTAADWELAKLGVDERFQGRGIGRILCEKTIEYCWAHDAQRILIETNSALAPALSLYGKLGFKPFIPEIPSPFTRANVFLELYSGEGKEVRSEKV